jgi:hypothetical protein
VPLSPPGLCCPLDRSLFTERSRAGLAAYLLTRLKVAPSGRFSLPTGSNVLGMSGLRYWRAAGSHGAQSAQSGRQAAPKNRRPDTPKSCVFNTSFVPRPPAGRTRALECPAWICVPLACVRYDGTHEYHFHRCALPWRHVTTSAASHQCLASESQRDDRLIREVPAPTGIDRETQVPEDRPQKNRSCRFSSTIGPSVSDVFLEELNVRP